MDTSWTCHLHRIFALKTATHLSLCKRKATAGDLSFRMLRRLGVYEQLSVVSEV